MNTKIIFKDKENRLSEIKSGYEEIIDSLTEEEKESDVLNQAKDAFIIKEVTKKLKELKGDSSEEAVTFRKKLEQYKKLSHEEKDSKSQIKKDSAALHSLTKKTIENLSDSEVFMLLEKKWIKPLLSNLYSLPDTVINVLVSKIQSLVDKYATTYHDVEKQIKETEKQLCSMIDELDGNEFDMKGLSEFKSLLMGK